MEECLKTVSRWEPYVCRIIPAGMWGPRGGERQEDVTLKRSLIRGQEGGERGRGAQWRCGNVCLLSIRVTFFHFPHTAPASRIGGGCIERSAIESSLTSISGAPPLYTLSGQFSLHQARKHFPPCEAASPVSTRAPSIPQEVQPPPGC